MEEELVSVSQALDEVKHAEDINQLYQIKAKLLGKSSQLTRQLRQIKSLSQEARQKEGKALNQYKQAIEAAIETKIGQLNERAEQNNLNQQAIDITLPGRRSIPIGSMHPLVSTERCIVSILQTYGFDYVTGPQVETEEYNFTALNIPANHPARAMHDTFYLANKPFLLRTHTSSVWFHALKARQLPVQIVASGRVYRCETMDRTHAPTFHQVEGLVIHEKCNFIQLKQLVEDFLNRFFGKELRFRFRASYFPFTEPSAEVDIYFNDQWLEVLGCGMVHPNVLRDIGIDSKQYSGFALGMGVERLAMLKYGIDDIRLFYQNAVEFLDQFPCH